MEKKIGWYSKEAAEIYGTVFYETPDGGEVELTAVGTEEGYKWKDKVCVGEVTKYIRRGEYGRDLTNTPDIWGCDDEIE